jgi:hypothetical protein
MNPAKLCLSAFLPLLVIASPAPAQETSLSPRTGVRGTGAVVIERDAELLRLDVQLRASAKTVKEALVELRVRGDQARQQVLGLGADAASVTIEPAKLVDPNEGRGNPMEQIMRLRTGRAEEKTDGERPVHVAASFSAQWKLTKKPHDELLASTHKLQQDLVALDLAGHKAAKKAEEGKDEAKDADAVEPGDEGADPGQPTFLFLAEVPSAERDKAGAEAFRRAAAQAERLARAAGKELGDVLSLDRVEPVVDKDPSQLWVRAMLMGMGAPGSPVAQFLERQGRRSDTTWAVGTALGRVEHRVEVVACFGLKGK